MSATCLDAVTVLRFVVAATLIVSVAASLTVMRLHLRAFRKLPSGAGLTPLHVALVAAGVMTLQTALAWAVLEGLTRGEPASPAAVTRTCMYGIGSVLILISLHVVATQQRRKVQFCRDQRTVVVTDTDTVAVHDEQAAGEDET